MKHLELDLDETVVIPKETLDKLLRKCAEFGDPYRHSTVRDMKAVVPYLKQFEDESDVFDVIIGNAIV